jgi:CubicO group peptidase (beta-lactamase class C family)
MRYEEFLQRRIFEPLGMTETTFWPGPDQAPRLAKSYRKKSDGSWEEIPIDQLSYPLTDRNRGVCPAGGLFSTASDVARFCQMILNGGTDRGRHFLSRELVAEMTSNQIGDYAMEDDRTDTGYGLGWRVIRHPSPVEAPSRPGSFGHGGAYATDMWMYPSAGLITVFMVQRAEFPSKDRPRVTGAFHRAALDEYGK